MTEGTAGTAPEPGADPEPDARTDPEPDTRATRIQTRVGVLVLFGTGVLTAAGSASLGLGTAADPGPGLWPLVVSLALVTFAVTVLVRPHEDGAAEPVTREAAVVLLGALSLALYTVLFERVGFELPTVLLLVLWMRGFGRESWRTTVLVAATATAVLYGLFILALGVSLPHVIVL